VREEKIDVIVLRRVYCTDDTARAQNTSKDMGDAGRGDPVHPVPVLLPRDWRLRHLRERRMTRETRRLLRQEPRDGELRQQFARQLIVLPISRCLSAAASKFFWMLPDLSCWFFILSWTAFSFVF